MLIPYSNYLKWESTYYVAIDHVFTLDNSGGAHLNRVGA